MTKSIWKFPVRMLDEQTIVMPAGAKILFGAVQHGIPNVWAEVDIYAPQVERTIRIYGTGWQLPDDPDWLEREFAERWRRKEEAYARVDEQVRLIFGLVLFLPFVPFAILGLIAAFTGPAQ